MDVPLPPRGYWAKLAAGKAVPKPPLHETNSPCSYERFVHTPEVDYVLESHKVEDTARGRIEDKVEKAVQWVADFAIRRNVENELRAERELARRKKAKEWQLAKENKDSLLATLAGFEKMAKDLDRAQSLRRLAEAIAARQDSAPAELIKCLKLMAHMADWLDPLIKASWPEIDSIGDTNPFGSLW